MQTITFLLLVLTIKSRLIDTSHINLRMLLLRQIGKHHALG